MQTKHVDNVVRLVKSPARSLPAAGEVVILGGGIMGTSIAYHLAEAGVQNVILIERNVLGSGSSAKPLGGVRATFSDPGNIRLGQRSLEAYERFSEKFRTDIGLRQVGYLFLCRNEAELLQVEDSTHIQNRLGGSSRMVSPEEAHITAWDLSDVLARGEPAVVVRDHELEHGHFYMDPCNLHPGEEIIVARRLDEDLRRAQRSNEIIATSLEERRNRRSAYLANWPD